MKLADIKKNFKRSRLLLRIWFWAAVHSPDFKQCQVLLYKSPIEVIVDRRRWGFTFLSISLNFNYPKWNMFIPSSVYIAFEKTHTIQSASEYTTHESASEYTTHEGASEYTTHEDASEYTTHEDIDDIPF